MSEAQDSIEYLGTISETLPGTCFNVTLDNGHKVRAYLAGKLRLNYIRLVVGDRVKVLISRYNLTQGRIIWRF